FVKDAFHDYLIGGRLDAVNRAGTGTKAAAHYSLNAPAGASQSIRLRLVAGPIGDAFGPGFDRAFASRIAEADEFYDCVAPKELNEDQRRVHRQALAGMLWTKQYYFFDLDRWLEEHGVHPMMSAANGTVRNADWFHMLNSDIISMPDKWEYP